MLGVGNNPPGLIGTCSTHNLFFYFDSPMSAATKGLADNQMICKNTIGTGMAPMIFWSTNSQRAYVLNYKTQWP
jgi:hypothetical protein